MNRFDDITTLGRGGSDTTAVAIAAALHADKCIMVKVGLVIGSCIPNPFANPFENMVLPTPKSPIKQYISPLFASLASR
jgi:hypothetical protein